MKMKKLWASLLCLMMVLVMVLTMTACEKDKKDDEDEDEKESTSQTDKGNKTEDKEEEKEEDGIVGEWEWVGTSFSQTGLLDGVLGDELGELEEYIDFGNVSINFVFDFNKDGTVVMGFGDVDQTVSDVVDAYLDAMEAYCEDNGASLEEMLKESGMTKAELEEEVEALAAEGLSVLEDIEETSYYELDGEDVLTGESKDDLTKEGTFDGKKIVLEMDGERLTLVRVQ